MSPCFKQLLSIPGLTFLMLTLALFSEAYAQITTNNPLPVGKGKGMVFILKTKKSKTPGACLMAKAGL